jgi:hypothetical protein
MAGFDLILLGTISHPHLGFTSTHVFERAGAIIDPKYHNSGDLSNRTNYDLGQVHAIAKVTVSTPSSWKGK